MTAALRKRILYAGRWVLGLALLGFLLLKVEWRPILNVFREISLPYLAVLLAFSFVLIWVSCVKWRMLIGEKGKHVSILKLMSLYMVGYFFSHFLPSQYGGDLVRSYELGLDIDSQVTSFGSVFMERYTGFVALMFVSGAAALFLPRLVLRPEVGIPFLAGWVIFFLLLWLLLDPRPVTWLTARLGGRFSGAAGTAAAFYREIRSAGRDRRVFLRVMLLSVLFHLLAVVNTWLAVLTIRSRVDFLPLMLVVPIILMVSTIPLTVNSIGLWEGAFVYFLAPLGLTPAQALSVALILRGKQVLQALFGGLVYLARVRRRR